MKIIKLVVAATAVAASAYALAKVYHDHRVKELEEKEEVKKSEE